MRQQGGWRQQGRRRGEGRGKWANKTSGGQNNRAEPYGSAPGFYFFCVDMYLGPSAHTICVGIQ